MIDRFVLRAHLDGKNYNEHGDLKCSLSLILLQSDEKHFDFSKLKKNALHLDQPIIRVVEVIKI